MTDYSAERSFTIETYREEFPKIGVPVFLAARCTSSLSFARETVPTKVYSMYKENVCWGA